MTQKMNKFNSLKKTTKVDFATYLGVIVVFIITTILQNNGSLKRSAIGLLVPICCYMSMAVSLNLTVGILIKPAWPRLSSPRMPTVRFSDTAMDM